MKIFLIAAAINQQFFVIALLLLFMGSVLGFLCFNFPPASIFMGDGGSMVLGFILSALTIRTTYYDAGNPDAPRHWYAVLMPLFVMAVPLYDFVIIMVLRIAKGRSPMTGDTNHFSHRLVRLPPVYWSHKLFVTTHSSDTEIRPSSPRMRGVKHPPRKIGEIT